MVAQIIVAAVIVEFLSEGVKALLPKVKGWIISLVFALAICMGAKLELCGLFGLNLPATLNQIITAIAISRGSNALHSLLKAMGVDK